MLQSVAVCRLQAEGGEALLKKGVGGRERKEEGRGEVITPPI